MLLLEQIKCCSALSNLISCPHSQAEQDGMALLCIDLALESMLDEASNAALHPFPCPLAAHTDVAIVRVPHEAVVAPFKLSVKFIEHEIRQQGGGRTALRRRRPPMLPPPRQRLSSNGDCGKFTRSGGAVQVPIKTPHCLQSCGMIADAFQGSSLP
jgi:hypothetical protein